MAFTGSPSNRTLSCPELIHFSIACSAARLRAPLLNPKRLIAASRKRLSRSSLNCSLNPAKHLAKLQRYIWTYSSFPVTVGSARSDESSIRKKLGARRFEVNLLDDRIELIPLGSVKALKGKHKGLLKEPWWKLEEKADRYVREGKR